MTALTHLDSPDPEPLLRVYRDGLLHDTLPFWIPRAIDREFGGYLTSLNEDGTIIHTDKPVWSSRGAAEPADIREYVRELQYHPVYRPYVTA